MHRCGANPGILISSFTAPYRVHAQLDAVPKDSALQDTSDRPRAGVSPDAPLLLCSNWLAASHVADNAEALRAAAMDAGTSPKAALEVRT